MLCPDTAFHAGLPDAAAVYALPGRWREKWGLRRYGFHGLSYAWALERAAELLGRPAAELDLVLAPPRRRLVGVRGVAAGAAWTPRWASPRWTACR